MDFINSYSMDKKRYWVLKDVYDVKKFEVFWAPNNKWSLKIDGNEDLKKFIKTLEKVCVETVENGSMTKDLAMLIGPTTKYLNTNQFLNSIDGNLKKKLN